MPNQSVPGARTLHATPRPAAVAACLVAVVALGGCATWGGFAEPHPGQVRERPEVAVGTARAKLHLSRPSGDAPPRLLLFHVTGDSGWHGLDPLYFDAMAARGYAIAGVSARAVCADLDAAGGARATPARAAEDYLALIATAEARLRLAPGTPVVITGLSRGAGLAVVAASQPAVSRRIAGVLLMGLTGVEEYVRPKLELFPLLDRIDRPLVLLQSTVDHYVPAAEARRRFGPDRPTRRLVAIDAGGHTFDGHRDELFRQVEAGLDWISPAPAVGAQRPIRSSGSTPRAGVVEIK